VRRQGDVPELGKLLGDITLWYIRKFLKRKKLVKMNNTTYHYTGRIAVASIAILVVAALNAISGCAPKAPPAATPGSTNPAAQQTADSRSRQIALLQQQLAVLQNDQTLPADQKARAQQSLQQEISALSAQTTP
jgi:hypothetical protein